MPRTFTYAAVGNPAPFWIWVDTTMCPKQPLPICFGWRVVFYNFFLSVWGHRPFIVFKKEYRDPLRIYAQPISELQGGDQRNQPTNKPSQTQTPILQSLRHSAAPLFWFGNGASCTMATWFFPPMLSQLRILGHPWPKENNEYMF